MAATVILLLLLAAGAALAWSRGVYGYALGAAAAAVLPALTLARELSWPALCGLGLVAAVGVWQRWARSASTVGRWSARLRRRAGVASSLDIARRAGTVTAKCHAPTVRPSLAALSLPARLRLRTGEVAVELCRVGPQRVWASIEDVTLTFGGPRTGKTGWLAGRVLDAPGAVLVTSTRTDLLELCGPLRAARGPVYVFNAVGLGAIPSSISFDPLTGCADPVTAVERASDMVGATSHGGGAGDRGYWEAQARRVLAALLHAAALGDASMRDVQAWVADADRAAREVPALLRRSGVPAFEQDALQFINTNERTRTSITSTLMPALGWLTHPAAAAAGQADRRGPGAGFDVATLIQERATVFLLGAEEANTAPLVCALTGHIAREARRLAAGMPSGRLDPTLTLALDEAALIAPVPLENWTADMGGRGVTILAAFQSRAQLLSRYGEHKTATILNNTAAIVLFGGTRDRDDLAFWSTLSGERDERITTTDLHGRVASRTVRKTPVLAAAQLANLPAGTVAVYRRGISPVVGRARMAWRRRDVRAAAFAHAHPELVARLAEWLELLQQCAQAVAGLVRATAATARRRVRGHARRAVLVTRARVVVLARWVRRLLTRRRSNASAEVAVVDSTARGLETGDRSQHRFGHRSDGGPR